MTKSRRVRPNNDKFLFLHDPRDRTWMDQAACRGTNPDLFFPERAENGMKNNPVKQICARCPVKTECLRYAMTTPVEKYGIWGGLSDKERRSLRRQKRRPSSSA